MTEDIHSYLHNLTHHDGRYFTRRHLEELSDAGLCVSIFWTIFHQAMLFVKMKVTVIEWCHLLFTSHKHHDLVVPLLASRVSLDDVDLFGIVRNDALW